MHLMRQRNDNAKASEQEVLAHFLAFFVHFSAGQEGMQIATMSDEGSVVGGVRTSDERRLELGLAGSDGTGSAGEGGNGSEALISQVPLADRDMLYPFAVSQCRNNLC